MKIKIKLVATNELSENGKQLEKPEMVRDALQVIDLDGKKLAVNGFGKALSNMLILANLPSAISDFIEYKRFLERLHDNDGEELEIDEVYIPIIKDKIKENYPAITVMAAFEMLDNAIAEATKAH
jgi:hypothetical protein